MTLLSKSLHLSQAQEHSPERHVEDCTSAAPFRAAERLIHSQKWIGDQLMKKFMLTVVASAALLSGAGMAAAQTTTTTTTTWTNEQGNMIREYSTVKKYSSVNDPSLNISVGATLPSNVTVYPLPETVKVKDPDRYSYVIVNDEPVVVERTTRRVIHRWDD
jgi:hypothetical protein